MSDTVRGVIVSHGALARALLEAVNSIVGPGHGLVAVSNEGCGAELLEERIAAVLDNEPTVVFVDMPGGSCFMAAAKTQRTHQNLLLVAGVNLPMLLDFVLNRDLDVEALARRLLECGANSIRSFPS